MKQIYLTRHGETEWNKKGWLQGWRDSPLTDKGKNDARSLGKRLELVKLDAIYTSPLQRARETANLINQISNIPVFEVEDLKEIFLGDWEGKTADEIEKEHQKHFSNFWNAPQIYDHTLHKAESLELFKRRVQNVLESITNDSTMQSVLIVAHAVVLKAVISYVRMLPPEKFWDPPFIHGASLTVIHWDGEKYELKLIGDTSHM